MISAAAEFLADPFPVATFAKDVLVLLRVFLVVDDRRLVLILAGRRPADRVRRRVRVAAILFSRSCGSVSAS
jgi:hypothetical protein